MIGNVIVLNISSADFEVFAPYLRCADQPGIRPQRCEFDLDSVNRNQPAILPDDFTHAIHEQVRAFHDAAAEHNCFGREERDEISQP